MLHSASEQVPTNQLWQHENLEGDLEIFLTVTMSWWLDYYLTSSHAAVHLDREDELPSGLIFPIQDISILLLLLVTV